MRVEIVQGDILDLEVEVIVNAWNRNLFPWWLLLPQGVSRAIKRRCGLEPFRELRKFGLLPLGGAVETGAGRLPYRAIIHVAGINLLWFATKFSIQESVRNTMCIVEEKEYASAAFPIIGSGSGNRSRDLALEVMLEAFSGIESQAEVFVVRFAG